MKTVWRVLLVVALVGLLGGLAWIAWDTLHGVSAIP